MRYRRLGAAAARAAEEVHARRVAVLPDHLELREGGYAAAFLEGMRLSVYRFTKYKAREKKAFQGVRELQIVNAAAIAPAVVRQSQAAGAAVELAPALVRVCRRIAREGRLRMRVYNRQALERLGANALLAVGQGSAAPPALVTLTYRPVRRARKVIALVGKGITFDSGGLSIKPSEGMVTMKCDMSGAAAVIAVMSALRIAAPAVEVRAYLPLAENMLNGAATRPGDIVKALNGKTIEILNTDAEGRLILADALSLAVREKPDQIIDVATLTGACVVALGDQYAGLFSSSDEIIAALQSAADEAGERMWRMPLAEEYRTLIKSAVADLKNTAGRNGGAITAALFLQEFVGDVPWAHLDIAGPAFGDKDAGATTPGGSGFAVRTLLRYLRDR